MRARAGDDFAARRCFISSFADDRADGLVSRAALVPPHFQSSGMSISAGRRLPGTAQLSRIRPYFDEAGLMNLKGLPGRTNSQIGRTAVTFGIVSSLFFGLNVLFIVARSLVISHVGAGD